MITRNEVKRFLGNFKSIGESRLMNRTYVPNPRQAIFIETSGRCNLACRFCAYAKTPPGSLMTQAAFEAVVADVCELGFSRIYLTPMLGEIFADPGTLQKFDTLEATAGVTEFSFHTNFILARPAQIQKLPGYRKLRSLYISLYGFDRPSFMATTRKNTRQFDKLIANLELLQKLVETWRPDNGIHINVRTVASQTPVMEMDTEISQLLRSLVTCDAVRVTENGDYDTWGGTISQSEVDPLGIKLTNGKNIYMYGACAKIFGEVQIKADGKVHACACRDVDGSLIIGDLAQQSLKSILSYQNPPYRELIESQMQGRYTDNCRSCSSYRSIYDHRPSQKGKASDVMTITEACKRLD